MQIDNKISSEKYLYPKNGYMILFIAFILFVCSAFAFIYAYFVMDYDDLSYEALVKQTFALLASLFYIIFILPLIFIGMKRVRKNQAIILSLFGKYYGTINYPGLFWVNPFTCKVYFINKNNDNKLINSKKVCLNPKTISEVQIVNNKHFTVNIVYKIFEAAKAVYNVDNYFDFLYKQINSSIHKVVNLKYDENNIEENIQNEIQKLVEVAGIKIIEAKVEID